MGIFDFFKKKEVEEIKLKDLKPKLNELKSLHENHINSAVEIIETTKKSIASAISELESAELKNPNIPKRALDIMQGNRKNYIQKLTNSVDDLPVPDLSDNLEDHSKEYSKFIEEAASNVQKNYFVLAEFFSSQVKLINRHLAESESSLIKNFKSWEKSGAFSYLVVANNLNDLESLKTQLSNLEQDKVNINSEISEIEKKSKSHKAKLSEIKKSNNYELLMKSKDEKEKLEESEKEVSSTIRSNFAKLDRVLKKLAHGGLNQEIIESYLSDPVSALKNDKELSIIPVLKNINLESYGLKQTKSNEVKEVINSLADSVLKSSSEKLNEIEDKKIDNERVIKNSTVLLNIKEQENMIEHYDSMITEKEEKLEKLEGLKEQKKPGLIIQQINKNLSHMNIKVYDEKN